jgi:DNA-binding response OmpR family regulator
MSDRVLIIERAPTAAPGLASMFEGHPDLVTRTVVDPRMVDHAIHEFEPDIVVLDLESVSPEGLEILRQLRVARMSPALLPVVVIAADTGRLARNSAFILGANDYLAKPLDAEEVLVRLRNLLHVRTLYLELSAAGRP